MVGEPQRKPNRLIDEASPYLLQHAHNPVDWYPWGPEALGRAAAEDRPILLSIGYAACHWCHVMERESFEDEAIAGLMNASFVCVKVDREERPDLDGIYMDAVQSMTGHGGWPMTVFLTPAGEPFYAGTYFPPEDRHGMPGFPRVLEALAKAWLDDREKVLSQGRRVIESLSHDATHGAAGEPLAEVLLEGAYAGLRRTFDAEWGGFGPAPKFPQPMTLELLLRLHLRGYEGALDMATLTLDRMAAGGMYDQLGGGFARYSTDRVWLVPHFEKMLYDNAQLARVYLHAWQVSGVERYRDVAVETLEYLLREMRHPDGGFFSSQDADSEGVEGKFFVWSWDELVGLVGSEAAEALGATPDGNWEGTNVLHLPDPSHRPDAEVRRQLFEARKQRVRPATDDKVLAAWNGLAIVAFAEAGRVLDEPRYVEAAAGAAGFVLRAMRRDDGRLLRAWRDGRVGGPGFVDDHAMMAAACLTLYETTFDAMWFNACRSFCDSLLDLFRDPDGGGFFQTGVDAERLVIRPKELFDNAVPSGNSVAAEVLQRLTLLTGEAGYERAGEEALRAVAGLMPRAPTMLGHALCALDLYLSRTPEVAIAGDPSDAAARALLDVVWKPFRPNVVLAAGSSDDVEAVKTVPLLDGRDLVDGQPAAYVCEHFTCRLPVTTPEALTAELA